MGSFGRRQRFRALLPLMFGALSILVGFWAVIIRSLLALISEKSHASIVEVGSLLHDACQVLQFGDQGIDTSRVRNGSIGRVLVDKVIV